jgi:hypothetical protein
MRAWPTATGVRAYGAWAGAPFASLPAPVALAPRPFGPRRAGRCRWLPWNSEGMRKAGAGPVCSRGALWSLDGTFGEVPMP